MVEGSIVDSYMDGFSSLSGNLFSVFIYCPEFGDVGSGVVIGHTVFLHCTGDMTCVPLLHFPNISWILLCKNGYNFLPRHYHFYTMFCYSCDGILSLG